MIHVENISKRYRIGEAARRYLTLRDRIAASVKGLARGRRRREESTIWALRDLSFEVKEGEVVGIIGHNGAGKSTLLKILSRITEPTTGYVELCGRVGCLLEVGTGFHPELTGRENIYLNAAILGMKKEEVERKFDDIVGFAEIEHFIDTPVKHYSTGMHMRLGFAVAAHLEPEILIVDEVLAVGDQAFQNRCLGKMQDVARSGRTVLFVSHNMGAISNLCTAAMWLDHGRLMTYGDVADTVAAYIKSGAGAGATDLEGRRRQGSGAARITAARLLDATEQPRTAFAMGETVVLAFDVEMSRTFSSLEVILHVRTADTALAVLHLMNADAGMELKDLGPGRHTIFAEIPNCLLYPGPYDVTVYMWSAGVLLDSVEQALTFSMVASACSKRTKPFYRQHGVYHAPSLWRIEPGTD